MTESSRTVRAAAVQLCPSLESREKTIRKVVSAIHAAADEGADLVVFPETVVPYYPYFSFVQPAAAMGKDHLKLIEESVEIPGHTTRIVSEAARKRGIVVSLGVNERDRGSLYNTQLLFDVDGALVQRRRKVTPSYHERMLWGRGDGSGLRAVDTAIGRIGSLACWEHFNPLTRYALMADHEEIHVSVFPGCMAGEVFANQIEALARHHAAESGCFVVNATGWLTEEQRARVVGESGLKRALTGGCYTAIVSPEGAVIGGPIREGEGMVVADLDMGLITKRKRLMDSVGHYSRPELLSLRIDRREKRPVWDVSPDAKDISPYPTLEGDSANHEITPRDVLSPVPDGADA